MIMTRYCRHALPIAVVAVAMAVLGFSARPYLVRDGLRLHGWLVATAFSATCQTDTEKADAIGIWHQTKRAVARLILPPSAYADPRACRVLAVRSVRNLIVNTGENYLVDAFQNLTEPENLRYHAIGTGTAAPAETDTALAAELTTQYNPDNTRATGSLTEGAATNVFRTVGTNTVDAAVAITEWGLMSQAAVPGGTLWSRVTFAAINLASGDSLQTTYDLTVE
jgi:hypothetical protein